MFCSTNFWVHIKKFLFDCLIIVEMEIISIFDYVMTDCYLASYSCIFRWGNELLFFLLMYVQI